MIERKLFYLPTDKIPEGHIEVHQLPETTKDEDVFKVNGDSRLFAGDDLASSLFALGITELELGKGKVIGIVVNSKDLEKFDKEHPT